jgi:ankyrin repeat protein
MQRDNIFTDTIEGNFSVVQQWLLNNPKDIDDPWSGWEGDSTGNKILMSTNIAGVVLTSLIFTAPIGFPLFLGSSIVLGVRAAISGPEGQFVDKERQGWTLLQLSAQYGHFEIAQFLLKHGACKTGRNGMDFREIAHKYGQTKFTAHFKLLEEECAAAAMKENQLKEALKKKDQELEKKKEENQKLQKAVQTKTDEITKLSQTQPNNPQAEKEIEELKLELLNINKIIQNYKQQTETDIIALVEKFEWLYKKYKDKVGHSPVSSPKHGKKIAGCRLRRNSR